jgi:cation efflux system membrane fusion protein
MRYQYSLLLQTIISLGILTTTPQITTAHVGHGDEFQATGGIQRVEVKPETDQILGIAVTPIAPATDGSNKVMIPITALVEADDKKLVFVQYENFYEPVEVKTGTTQGELIEVIDGLSVGEKLVTQGSLSLYAESRKTNSTEATTETTTTNETTTNTVETTAPATTSATTTTTNQSATTTDQANSVNQNQTANQTANQTESQTTTSEQTATNTDQNSGGTIVPFLFVGGLAGVLGTFALVANRKKPDNFSDYQDIDQDDNQDHN